MLFALTAVQWAQVAGPVFAFFAACGALGAVLQARRSFATTRLPQLNGYWINRNDGKVMLKIDNTGGGYGRVPSFCVVTGDHRVRGSIATLSPGEQIRLIAELPHQEPGTTVTGVLVCLDSDGRWHVWSWDGRHRAQSWREHRAAWRDPDEALQLMYRDRHGRNLTDAGWWLADTPTRGRAAQE